MRGAHEQLSSAHTPLTDCRHEHFSKMQGICKSMIRLYRRFNRITVLNAASSGNIKHHFVEPLFKPATVFQCGQLRKKFRTNGRNIWLVKP